MEQRNIFAPHLWLWKAKDRRIGLRERPREEDGGVVGIGLAKG
jgi:hypothetical protein